MTEKDVIRKAMSLRKWSFPIMVKEMKEQNIKGVRGEFTPSNLSGFMNNNENGMRFDNFFKMLTVMGCEIVIKDKHHNKEWIIDMKQED